VERPARLPATRDDLDDWSVYADWLQTQGDPGGERIAMELALPERPSRDQLAAFQKTAARPAGDHVLTGYMLNRLHSLVVRRDVYNANAIALERAAVLLESDAGRFVEYVHVPLDPPDHTAAVARIIAALPPTCRRLGLDLCARIEPAAARMLLNNVPDTVREISLGAHGVRLQPMSLTGLDTWLEERFDAIEVRLTRSTIDVALQQYDAIAPSVIVRLAGSDRLRVQWTAAPDPIPAGTVVGRPGDAALVGVHDRRAFVLSRWSSAVAQDEHGRLPVRAQLASDWEETHTAFLYTSSRNTTGALHSATVELRRRRDAWQVRRIRKLESDTVIRVDGVPLDDELVPIGHRSTISSEHWHYVFVANEVAATVRDVFESTR
jgi:uncharacterized protein (TIGR02996 family)